MRDDFLGVGWGFPFAIDAASGQVARAEYETSIEQSIRIILETARGERVMRPDFGCGLHEMVFAVNNAGTRGIVATEVHDALLKWEPRIEVIDVEADASGAQGEVLLINIEYRVRATDTRFNMVYPFYLNRSPV
jgi:phage baseplate assembly protein W